MDARTPTQNRPDCEIEPVDAALAATHEAMAIDSGAGDLADNDDELERSIQAFMSRFGGSPPQAYPQGSPPRESQPTAEHAPDASQPQATATEEGNTAEAQQPSRSRPTTAPEQRDHLAAMRHVANSNARQAIAVNRRHRLVQTMRWIFLLATMCMGASMFLAILAPGVESPRYGIALAVGFLAVIFTFRFLRMCGELGRLARQSHGMDPQDL